MDRAIRLARLTRSAAELCAAAGHPTGAHLLRRRPLPAAAWLSPRAPARAGACAPDGETAHPGRGAGRSVGGPDDAGARAVRMAGGRHAEAVAVDHLVIETAPPHRTLALQAVLVVPELLPPEMRDAVSTGTVLLDVAAERTGASWTSTLLELRRSTAGHASYPFDLPPASPVLRVTRQITINGGPIAVAVDEIPTDGLFRGGDAAGQRDEHGARDEREGEVPVEQDRPP
jgi:hypothetical protein